MVVCKTISELRNHLSTHRSSGKSIGFVPTMGALHEGHLSLIHKAQEENEVAVVSIFVNPIQFNNKEDLDKYPRDLQADMTLLKKENCQVLFCPEAAEMYPQKAEEPTDLGNITNVLEGSFRPGHFDGVSVVVKRLFEIVEPQNAYFGLKDYQQYLVVKTMSEKLGLEVNVVGCPTKRESDGLAMSSRNLLLSEEGRRNALLFFQCLDKAKKEILSRTFSDIRETVVKEFESHSHCELEYFEIVNATTLQTVSEINSGESIIACIAGYIDGVRLIDNLILIP